MKKKIEFPVILKSIRVSVLSFAKKSGKISRIFLVIGFFKKFERSRRLYKILTDENETTIRTHFGFIQLTFFEVVITIFFIT